MKCIVRRIKASYVTQRNVVLMICKHEFPFILNISSKLWKLRYILYVFKLKNFVRSFVDL